MQATHADAERRYTEIRATALRVVSTQVPASTNLTFRLIDGVALRAAAGWDASHRRRVDWDWFGGYGAFKYRYPKRFELALWHRTTLASLSLGRPTYHGSALRLDFVEANPDARHVRVFPAVLTALTVYAEALGADELRIMNPINDNVKTYYERFGLSYVGKGDYLYIRL